MRRLLLVAWIALPVAAYAYHRGPGQKQIALDDVSALLARADNHVVQKQWQEAETEYEKALNQLPADMVDAGRRIRIERAKVQMQNSKLPTAHQDLKGLVEELVADPSANRLQLRDARAALANSQYYMTWLMRLEGQPQERWEPEIESSRQIYRLLAEQAEAEEDRETATQRREDLESSIRLARMDLSDLQGLPLPSQ